MGNSTSDLSLKTDDKDKPIFSLSLSLALESTPFTPELRPVFCLSSDVFMCVVVLIF